MGKLGESVLHAGCAGVTWVMLHPWRLPSVVTPRVLRLPYRAFRLRGDGVDLAAWHVPCEGSRAGIVLCHGHDNCRMQVLPLVRPLHAAGFHVLLFDHRTMGLSGGDYCSYGLREQHDLTAAAEWLRREAGVERVGYYGVSMGGATALLAAATDPRVDAVVTDCAFARLEEMVEQRFFLLPRPLRAPIGRSVRYWAERWCGRVMQDVDPERALSRGQPRPVLVIHGEKDRLTPVAHARRLAVAGGEQAELWLVPGAGHVGSRRRAGRSYVERVVAFFQKHVVCVAKPQTDML